MKLLPAYTILQMMMSGCTDSSESPDSFTVTKIVVLGASITDQTFSAESVRAYMEQYIKSKYGLDITIVERATAGWDSSDLKDDIDTIIADYVDEPDTHYLMHLGGNDTIFGTPFLDLSESIQATKIANLEYIYDAIHAQGKKLIQTSLTHRNYSSDCIDNDPTDLDKELLGSYTYTRDWIVPVMEDKAPEYIINGWTKIDAYNVTRNNYFNWDDDGDVVHPNDWARVIFAQCLIEGFVKLSLGIDPDVVTARNFNDTVSSGSAIDVVFGVGCTQTIGETDDNINWAAISQYDSETNPLLTSDEVDTSGNSVDVRLYSVTNKGWVDVGGNTTDPTNSTASLLNNTLLDSYRGMSTSGAVIYAMIDGLDPISEYEVSVVSARTDSDEQLNNQYINAGVPVSVDVANGIPENNINTSTIVSDYLGRVFVAVGESSTENTAILNGIKVTSGG